jgi:hypothetical protein
VGGNVKKKPKSDKVPIILAAWEAEIKRIMILGKWFETPSPK